MYIDINSVSLDTKANTVLIEGTDLDATLLNDWTKAVPKSTKVNLLFNLDLAGNRIYLYKLIRSQVKEPYKTMEEALTTLTGKIMNISGSFKV